MGKATDAGRTKTGPGGTGMGTSGGGATAAMTANAPPVCKGGNYSSYTGSGKMAIPPTNAPDRDGKPLGKAGGNIKTGGGVSLPEGENGPEKITGNGDLAPRIYKK